MFPEKVFDIALDLRLRSYSLRAIEDLLHIGKSTLQRWFSMERKHKYVRTNTMSKITAECKPLILNLCHKFPYYSIKHLITVIKDEMNLNLSSSTLYRFMKSNNLKYSRVYYIGNGKDEQINEKRLEFSKVFRNLNVREILCVDETSIYSKLHYKNAWTTSHTRSHLPIQRVTSKRNTLTACFAMDGMIHYDSSLGSMNEKSFLSFLKHVVSNSNKRYKYLLMDNVAFHKTKQVQKYLTDNDIQPLYSSPY